MTDPAVDRTQHGSTSLRYAELHAHSAFSFLDGASQPEELAAEASRLGLRALAVTDHDGLYGVVRFAQAAKAVGLPTVFGAELHAHSAFSFLDGASHPEELAAEGARLGLSALAVTDHDGLYGVVRFAEAARKVGLPTIFGAELHLPVVDVGRTPAGLPVLDPPTGLPDPRSTHLLVLARGAQGYRNLSSAIATAHLATGTKGAARYDLDALGAQGAGEWLVLTGCRKGSVRRALVTAGRAAARRELDRLVALFGAGNVAVEITATDDPRDADLHAALADLAADARLPLVATTAAHYANPRDADLAGARTAASAPAPRRRTCARRRRCSPATPGTRRPSRPRPRWGTSARSTCTSSRPTSRRTPCRTGTPRRPGCASSCGAAARTGTGRATRRRSRARGRRSTTSCGSSRTCTSRGTSSSSTTSWSSAG